MNMFVWTVKPASMRSGPLIRRMNRSLAVIVPAIVPPGKFRCSTLIAMAEALLAVEAPVVHVVPAPVPHVVSPIRMHSISK